MENCFIEVTRKAACEKICNIQVHLFKLFEIKLGVVAF